MATDLVLPFVFETIPVRGALVHLGSTWRRLQQDHDYPPAVAAAVGEAAAATLLIAQSLKAHSTLTLQISGKGPMSMLVMQASSALEMRGLASAEQASDAQTFRDLVGNGHCAVTVDNEQSEQPYQGIVEIAGETLADSLQVYYARSAQIPSHLSLVATADRCGGILLQQMPGSEPAAQDDWERLGLMAATLGDKDLTRGIDAGLVGRLFPEDDVRVFRGRPTMFRCRCTRGRAANVLQLLGAEDCHAASEEQGTVVVTCEYCGRRESFDRVDIAELFANTAAPHSDSVH
ncbi:MAG: Hsp33 family molecular chaperone HslO [Pseudomonadota bacterium]